MKISRNASVAGAMWRLVVLLAALHLSSGCGSPPPPEGHLAMENVAKWYQNYRSANRNRPPANEKQFVAYIRGRLKARNDATDVDQILTSPRDGQRFVIRYGKPNSTRMERNVAAHEKEGYGGKKLVGFEVGYAIEVDDADLEEILARK